MWYKNIACRFFGFVTKHACQTDGRTDRQTDGQTYRIATPKTALAQLRRTVKSDFPHAQYAFYLHAIDTRRAVKCRIAAVTWCDVTANHRCAAHSIPHFTFRIPHAAVPHFTHSPSYSPPRICIPHFTHNSACPHFTKCRLHCLGLRREGYFAKRGMRKVVKG